MLYLINCLRRERDRPAAFRAVGLYAIAVQGEIKRHLSQVMAVIKASLPTREALTKKSRGSNAHPVMDPSGKRIWHRPCFFFCPSAIDPYYIMHLRLLWMSLTFNRAYSLFSFSFQLH